MPLLSTEDKRFYDHSGIDGMGVLRAVVKLGMTEADHHHPATGQIYAGTGFHNIARRVIEKLKEWITAVRLERNFTKEEISGLISECCSIRR